MQGFDALFIYLFYLELLQVSFQTSFILPLFCIFIVYIKKENHASLSLKGEE